MARSYRRRYKKSYRTRRGRGRPSMAKSDFGTTNNNSAYNRVDKIIRYGRNTASILGSLAGVVKTIASVVNAEKQTFDTTFSGAFVAPVGTAGGSCLNLIAQGTAENQRKGNSILVKSIQGRLNLLNSETVPHNVRVIMVRDMQCNGVAPVLSDVLEAPTNILSPLNIMNGNAESRFAVLIDKYITLNYPNSTERMVPFYFKTMFHTKYLDATANVTGLGQNSIFLWILADTASVVSGSSYWRIRYYDN